MTDRDERKKGLQAMRILQKRIVKVTKVLKTNLDHFNSRLREEGLVSDGRYDPDDRVMKKAESATILYSDCMTVVEIDPAKFSVVVDILGEFSLLESTVHQMKEEGVEAGLMKARLDKHSSRDRDSTKAALTVHQSVPEHHLHVSAGSKRKHNSHDEEPQKAADKDGKKNAMKPRQEVPEESSSDASSLPSSSTPSSSCASVETEAPDTVLVIADLNTLFKLLRDVAHQWEPIGLQIHLVQPKLNKLAAENHAKDQDSHLRSVLKMWLLLNYDSRKFGKPTWRMLVRALEDVEDCKPVAEAILEERPWKC